MLTDSVSNNGWKQAGTCKIVTQFQNLTDLCLKDDPFFEFANSHLASLKKYSFFAKMGTSIDIRFDREGAFYQCVCKAYVKLSLSILCMLCLFFLYVVVVIELTRFRGPYCLGTLYWYSHFCDNHEGHNNWPKPSHSKILQIANCMHKPCDAPCIIPAVVG